ncbi:MAG: hypothetical protein AAF492_20770, partial [Verrucomicrobiota bacterium]
AVFSIPFWTPQPHYRFIKEEAPPSALRLVSAGAPATSGVSPSRVLLRNFLAEGLPPESFLIPYHFHGAFVSEEEKKREDLHFFNKRNLRTRYVAEFAEEQIRATLPAGTKVRRAERGSHYSDYYRLTSPPPDEETRIPNGLIGHLTGSALFQEFSVKYAGAMPFKRGAQLRSDNARFMLTDLQLSGTMMRIRLEAIEPHLLFGSELSGKKHRLGRQETHHLLVVLHQPKRNEALIYSEPTYANHAASFALAPFSSIFTRIHKEAPLLRKGESHEDWQLHLYRVNYDQLYRVPVDLARHPWENRSYSQLQRKRTADDLQLTDLPENPTHEQLVKFARVNATVKGRYLRRTESDDRTKKLLEGGPELVPILLDMLPAKNMDARIIRDAIRQLCTEEHLPLIRKAFPLDPDLDEVVRVKKWQGEVKDVIQTMLKKRYPYYSSSFLTIAANYRDPEMYEDLTWHAVYGHSNQDYFYETLEKDPGYDFEPMLAKAWERQLRAGRPGNLMNMATKYH